MADDSETVWIAELCVSDSTEQKLTHKHRITVDEVEQAVKCVAGLRGSWDHDRARGSRMLLHAAVRGRPVLVVLYPTSDPDVWNLGSVHFRT